MVKVCRCKAYLNMKPCECNLNENDYEWGMIVLIILVITPVMLGVLYFIGVFK